MPGVEFRLVRRGVWLLALAATACLGGGGITPIHTPFDRGVHLQAQGDLEAAIGEYREALEEDPDDWRARFNLATAYDALAARRSAAGEEAAAAELRERAERTYRSVLAQRPANVRALVNLAALEAETGRSESARRRLEAAIEAAPDLALPYTALAAHLRRQGDDAGARRRLRQALEVDPSHPGALLLLGDLERERGRVEEARRAYRRALARADDEPGVLLALGELEVEAGRSAEARSWLERVLHLDPEHFRAHLLLARLAEARGALEDAAWHVWQARRTQPAGPGRGLDFDAWLLRLYEGLARSVRAGASSRAARPPDK